MMTSTMTVTVTQTVPITNSECSAEDCTSVGDEDGNYLADCADGCTISIDAFGNTGFCESTGKVVKTTLTTMVMV